MATDFIGLSWNTDTNQTRLEADEAVSALMGRYRALPRHIARKHLGAAMKRLLKRGIPILRSNTPPLGVRRGRRKVGERAKSTGSLRKSVTTRSGQTGRNNDYDSFVWGCLGYRYGIESRKAIWLENGTRSGGPALRMLAKTMQQFGPISASELAREMAAALENATKEVAGGRNPGRNF